MSQARGKEGLFLKFICNCESIQACAGMPALCLKKRKKEEKRKAASSGVSLLRGISGTSEPLKVLFIEEKRGVLKAVRNSHHHHPPRPSPP